MPEGAASEVIPGDLLPLEHQERSTAEVAECWIQYPFKTCAKDCKTQNKKHELCVGTIHDIRLKGRAWTGDRWQSRA